MTHIDFSLHANGPIGKVFIRHGLTTFHNAAEFVRQLPYGRPNASSWLAVLEEGRGTCSSKHALLAMLAHEQGHPEVHLMVGIYEMGEHNTPGVGPALAPSGLTKIPEAHCYLRIGDTRIDVTGLPMGRSSVFDSLLEEEIVDPATINVSKPRKHRSVITAWSAAHGLDAGVVWNVREACIAILANNSRKVADSASPIK